MSEIVLQPANPLDLRPEDLEELAQDIREAATDYEVRIAGDEIVDPRRRGVTWWEVLTVWLPAASDNLGLVIVIAQAVAWARRRLKKEQAEQVRQHEEELAKRTRRRGRKPVARVSHRPKYIEILGPSGEVLKAVLIEDPENEPKDITQETREKRFHT